MELTKNEIIKQLDQLICFLEPLHSLVNTHMSSFFADSVWDNHVPLNIHSELKNIDSVNGFIELFPEIIRKKCPNDFAENHKVLVEVIEEALTISIIKDKKYSELLLLLESLFKSKVHTPCQDLQVDEFMTQKKLHEVKITSKMALQIHNLTGSSHVVDVGGGKGYLSCTLAYQYGVKVLSLDFSEETTCGAIKRSDKLARFLKREIFESSKNPAKELSNKNSRKRFMQNHYKQIITFVKPDTNSEDILKESFNEEITGITLTGLHTCGDLSSTCLRMFLNSRRIKGIINIGCCYNKITEEFADENVERDADKFGFPLSSFLQKKNYKLGQNARMAACYSVDRINSDADFESSQTLLFYRAIFEVVRRMLNLPNSKKKVGQYARKSRNFNEYLTIVLKKLGSDTQLAEREVNNLYEYYVDKKPFMTAFYILRASLAPVVESIILLDRILYLLENDVSNVYLVPLFNLEISPRGFGIIAWKDFDKK